MPRFQTNLLVRDNRLAMFEAEGCTVQHRILNDAEFDSELRRKLLEEANEAVTATEDDLLKELADIVEVAKSLASTHGYSWQTLQNAVEERHAKLGGFSKRIYTEWLESEEGTRNTTYHRQFPEKYPEVK